MTGPANIDGDIPGLLGARGAENKVVYPNLTNPGSVIFSTFQNVGLNATQLAALTTTQIAALTSGLVLSDAAVSGALTTTVINALTPGKLYDLAVGSLTTTQLAALQTTTIAAITSTQLAALTDANCIGQVAATYGAAVKPDLPIGAMLVVAPVSGQTLTVAVKPKT